MDARGHTVTKKALLKSVREMPDRVSVEELIDRVLLLSKIERGLEQSTKGEVYTTEEARKRLREHARQSDTGTSTHPHKGVSLGDGTRHLLSTRANSERLVESIRQLRGSEKGKSV